MWGNFVLCIFSALSEAQAAELARKVSLGLFLFSLQTCAWHLLFSFGLNMHITIVRGPYSSIVINRGLRSMCSPAAFLTFQKLPSYSFVCHWLTHSFIGSFVPSLAHSLLHWLIRSFIGPFVPSLVHWFRHWVFYFHRLTHSWSTSSARIQALENLLLLSEPITK